MSKCAECGSEVGPGEQFCGNCGAPVEATEALPVEEADVLSSGETILAEAPVIPDPEPEPIPVPSEPEYAPPPPPPPPAPAEGGSKKKTWIIIAIVAVVLLLCCCCPIAIGAIAASTGALEDVIWELENLIEEFAMIAPSVIQIILA